MKFYKLGYFFLSKVNNITESLEKGLDKVVSRGEKNFSVHRKYMNFLRPRKTALDEPLYKLSAGRSMVEMLGVLAIIGILSVGAIAGYSKAMMKYRLNKQAEQISWLLNILDRYKSQWVFDEQTDLVPYYIKLGEIPKEMIKDDTIADDGRQHIYDALGNDIVMRTNLNNETAAFDTVALQYYVNNGSFDVCQNIWNAAREFHEQIYYAGAGKGTGDTTSYTEAYYGDRHCTPQEKCLKDISMDNIYEECRYCTDSDWCVFLFVF